jgi:hypothetical protein
MHKRQHSGDLFGSAKSQALLVCISAFLQWQDLTSKELDILISQKREYNYYGKNFR